MEKYIKNKKYFNRKYKLIRIFQNIKGHFNSATIYNYDSIFLKMKKDLFIIKK